MPVISRIYISTRHPLFAASLTKISESCEVSERQERALSKRFLLCLCIPSRLTQDRASAFRSASAKLVIFFYIAIRGRKFFGRIFCEKFCENGKLYVTLQRLRRGALRLGTTIVLWCNGSTTVFGSVCLGSNPGKTTIREEGNLKAAWPNGFFLLFCRRVVSEFYTGLSRGIYGTISGYGLLFVPTLPRPSI